MESWLKRPPAKAPKPPPHIVFEVLMAHAQELEAAGTPDPALSYIRAFGPRMELDEWGQPLPFSDADQDEIDNLVAVLSSPVGRTHELMLSGLLEPTEVDAVSTVYPQAYAGLVEQAYRELMDVGPPIEAWAEATLAVLFREQPAKVFSLTAPPQQQQGGQGDGKPPGTQAERREPAVREETT